MDSTNSTPNPSDKAIYDPGWNDPPKLLYSAQQSTPGRPRNFLNKRVAFPLTSTAPNQQQPTPKSLPSMPSAPLNQSMNIMPIQCLQEPVIDSGSTLKEVKEILFKLLENSGELGSKANDIKRRLVVMEDMWLNGKLNERIHMQMMELACALRDDLPSKADDIHRALMVDHVSSVGTWMPGVKQLIHHCIARSELLAIDKEQPEVKE